MTGSAKGQVVGGLWGFRMLAEVYGSLRCQVRLLIWLLFCLVRVCLLCQGACSDLGRKNVVHYLSMSFVMLGRLLCVSTPVYRWLKKNSANNEAVDAIIASMWEAAPATVFCTQSLTVPKICNTVM